MTEWWTRGDSACGSVPVVPPVGWPSRPSLSGRSGFAKWSVGGREYSTWEAAWREGIASSSPRSSGRAPAATRYLRAWSVGLLSEETSDDGLQTIRDAGAASASATASHGGSASATASHVTGIDLAVRGIEVRKLLYAGFGYRMSRGGYDPEEVLQEVYRGLLVRNRGKCPFDVRKSSFGHYVHMVIECVLSNYHRRESRRRASEQSWEDLPAGQVDSYPSTDSFLNGGVGDRMALTMLLDRVRSSGFLSDREVRLAEGVLPLLQSGYACTARGAREAGWSLLDWRDGVTALRRVALASALVEDPAGG